MTQGVKKPRQISLWGLGNVWITWRNGPGVPAVQYLL